MAARNYTNLAAPRTTSSSLGAVAAGTSNTLTLSSVAGLPATPFTASLERTTASEELVLVTGVAGTTATLTRGYDGTASPAHASGVLFEHVVGSIDYSEANAHVNATTGVHGVTGSVVGTGGAQTLDLKTLTRAIGAAGTSDPALALRAWDADSTVPLLRGTSQDGSATVLSVDGVGVVAAAAQSLQPATDRVVQTVKASAAGATNDLTGWRAADGTLLARVAGSGAVVGYSNAGVGGDPLASTRLSVLLAAAGSVGVAVRGAASQSADLVRYTDSGANPLGAVGADGTRYGPGYGHTSKTGPRLAASTTGMQIASTAVGDQPLSLKRYAGQTADLLQVQDEAGVAVTRLDPDAALVLAARGAAVTPVTAQAAASQTAPLVAYKNSAGTVVGRVGPAAELWGARQSRVGTDNFASNVSLAVSAANVGDVPLLLWGAVGQTNVLAVWYDNPTSNTELGGLTLDGRLYTDAVKLGIRSAASTTPTTAPVSTALDTSYPFGTSARDATLAAGYPADGVLVTHRYNRVRQVLLAVDARVYTRASVASVWTAWRGGFLGYGETAYAELTAADTGAATGTLTDVPGLSVTVTLAETRLLRVTSYTFIESTVAGDRGRTRIADASGTTLKTSATLTLAVANTDYQAVCCLRTSLAAGTYTFKVQRERVAGSGNIKVNAATSDRSYVMVEDLGLPSS